MLTPEQITEIRKRAERATPGPWWVSFGNRGCYVKDVDREEDAVFIANSRKDIPALLAHIDAQNEAYCDAREVSNAEINRWKARCEAMERAIKNCKYPCFACKKTNATCMSCEFEFDEARFACCEEAK